MRIFPGAGIAIGRSQKQGDLIAAFELETADFDIFIGVAREHVQRRVIAQNLLYQPGDAFGRHVALDGATGFVTATGDDDRGVDSGAAYELDAACDGPGGDVTGDGRVDMLDLLLVLSSWGASPSDPTAPCPGDTNGDGHVNLVDLLRVLADWS